MINLTWNSVFYEKPFRHVEVTNVLEAEAAKRLRDKFPRRLNSTKRDSGTDKTYVVSNRQILSIDGVRHIRAACWNQFLDALEFTNYRSYLSEISGVALNDCLVDVDVNSYATGGYMSAHTDRPEKILSHIIYLSPSWSADWGGQLTLLDGREGSVVRSITPQWPMSVILLRSDYSWHSVAEMMHPEQRRLTIQISFWSRRRPPASNGRIRVRV